MAELVIAQVLLVLIIGLWVSAKFKESEIIKFFGRNDWFVGAFLVIVGYMDYVVYTPAYIRNLSLMLIVIGVILILFSIKDHFTD